MGISGSTPTDVSASAGYPAPVIAMALALSLYLAPCPHAALPRPPRLPQIARLSWRAITIFSFTIVISVMSLATVAMSCEMAVQSLDVAIVKFAMASTVY